MDAIFTSLDLSGTYHSIGSEKFASCYAVTQLATASQAAVGEATADLVDHLNLGPKPEVMVDSRLASLWFAASLMPIGWKLPPSWDVVAGDYPTKDGWIRLHTNRPHHRAAALKVLEAPAQRDEVSHAAKNWMADDLESAIVAEGGAAAALRSAADWAAHPQGQAVAEEPLIHWEAGLAPSMWPATYQRPLQGLRILDLTRILAGPVATRILAGLGAEVLRIDPPDWDEPDAEPEVTLGKTCAKLDLRTPEGRSQFESLLSKAHVLMHGYRPGALEGLGYDRSARLSLAPNLVEVSLNAYGWTGPWAGRRGFDSLVQMSSGIAHTGMGWAGRDHPTPLPVQALDHATGYLMAAALLRLLTKGGAARLSLARTAELLKAYPQHETGNLSKTPAKADFEPKIEETPWGPAHRLKPAVNLKGIPIRWDRPTSALGSAPAKWLTGG